MKKRIEKGHFGENWPLVTYDFISCNHSNQLTTKFAEMCSAHVNSELSIYFLTFHF